MSLNIKTTGLYGLVMKIHDEIKEGKSLDEILSKYPVSKSSLPYLLTILEEFSVVLVDFVRDNGKLESENNALKDKIKQLESDIECLSGEDTMKELSLLRERVRALENEIVDLQEENLQLKDELLLFERFVKENFFGALLYKRFLNAL